MPRYFFHIEDGRLSSDTVGIVLDGPKEARSQAVMTAGVMLRDLDGEFWDAPEQRIHVTDEWGATVCALFVRGTTGTELEAAPGARGEAHVNLNRPPLAPVRL